MKSRLLQQLDADTRWLQMNNITDYSLLIGIHYLSLGEKEKEKSEKEYSARETRSKQDKSNDTDVSLREKEEEPRQREEEKEEKREEEEENGDAAGEGEHSIEEREMVEERNTSQNTTTGRKNDDKDSEKKEEKDTRRIIRISDFEPESSANLFRRVISRFIPPTLFYFFSLDCFQDFGGILSSDGKEIYSLGVIDILTQYDIQVC
jgi:hypothetical protein